MLRLHRIASNEDFLTEDAKAGELRLQRHRTSWELHVTVTDPIEEPTGSNDYYVEYW